MTKTYEQLMTEYWSRIVPMVNEYNKKHGTDIKPWECVKYKDNGTWCDHPSFIKEYCCYKFAVTILEGKPVFAGDMVYSTYSTLPLIAVDKEFDWNLITLTPPKPKRIFLLNGVEFECPVNDITDTYISMCGEVFYFSSNSESYFNLCSHIKNILTEARDN